MNKLIKYTLLLCAVALSTTASAWKLIGHEAIVIHAEQNLEPNVKATVEKILGCTMKESVALFAQRSDSEQGTTTVTTNLRSTTKEPNDNVVRFEAAVALLANPNGADLAAQKEALQKVIYLISELHNPGAIAVEGQELNFEFSYNNGRFPDSKFLKITKSSWCRYWNDDFFGRHIGASPEMYAYDTAIFSRGHEREFSLGTPRDWVEQTAADCAPVRQHFSTEKEVQRTYLNNIEDMFDRCRARAGLRLAATLNTLFNK